MPTETDWAWAAGLFVGEGTVVATSNVVKGFDYRYFLAKIEMYDERSIRRFGAITDKKVYLGRNARDHETFIVAAKGRAGEEMVARMWPWLAFTDKGDQAIRVARKLGIESWITHWNGTRRPRAPRGSLNVVPYTNGD